MTAAVTLAHTDLWGLLRQTSNSRAIHPLLLTLQRQPMCRAMHAESAHKWILHKRVKLAQTPFRGEPVIRILTGPLTTTCDSQRQLQKGQGLRGSASKNVYVYRHLGTQCAATVAKNKLSALQRGPLSASQAFLHCNVIHLGTFIPPVPPNRQTTRYNSNTNNVRWGTNLSRH